MRHSPNSAGAKVHGRCPSAWRPMMAGDGLLVRVRPALSRLSREQALGLSAAADRYGNGAIDITNRAGLQIRGVSDAGLADLLADLVALDLIAADPEREARPAILVAPDWTHGDDTVLMARQLADRLDELPELPGKVGFAIDLSGAPALSHVPADFRLERDAEGGLLVRAEGRETGVGVTPETAVDVLLELARWFAQSGGAAAGRMARHRASLPAMLAGEAMPAEPRRLAHGSHILGHVLGVPFGRLEADKLASLSATGLRITPWRQVLLEGVTDIPADDFPATTPDVDACVGAPACPQATVETRALALRLAGRVSGSLHVSGCAKGCARPNSADIVLTGRDGLYDLAFDARAGDPPAHAGLDVRHIISLLGAT